jgi:uncharacterized protein YgbK (DUF1537 family)
MLPIAVVADDLTGAADTAIHFRRAAGPAVLVTPKGLAQAAGSLRARVLALSTETRTAPAAEAAAKLAAAARALKPWKPRLVYKKVDSCLRGNLGAEIDALVEHLGKKVCFLAPALPAQGRTTVHGLHLVHGVPVAETEMAHDPLTPVHESRLAELVRVQSRQAVAHLGQAHLDQGLERTAAEIDRLLAQGVGLFTADAAHQGHLDLLAELALTRFPEALLAGSAGLAQSLAWRLARGRPKPLKPRRPRRGGFLLVCGSASGRLAGQAAALEKAGVARLELPAAGLISREGSAQVILSGVIAARLVEGSLIVNLEPPGSAPADPIRLAAALAQVVAGAMAASRPGALFLSGGDTALAVLGRLGSQALRLEAEILPGLVQGVLADGVLAGLPVVTKAGAFGAETTLVELYRQWYAKE